MSRSGRGPVTDRVSDAAKVASKAHVSDTVGCQVCGAAGLRPGPALTAGSDESGAWQDRRPGPGPELGDGRLNHWSVSNEIPCESEFD